MRRRIYIYTIDFNNPYNRESGLEIILVLALLILSENIRKISNKNKKMDPKI
jgi:hypothetical protein